MGLHFVVSDVGSRGFPKNNKADRCSRDLLISFDFHPHEFFLQMMSMGTRHRVGTTHIH